jgi:DNA-directed RNA polymerase specialized sigma24 family protein
MDQGSVTGWIGRLKAGDPAAAAPLWDAYFGRLVALARDRLRGAARRAADEEDAALSAFDSFCTVAAGGGFPHLGDRNSLWPLLAALTRNKCVDLIRRENRQKRGGGRAAADGLDDLLARDPPPELAAELADELTRLLTVLDAAGDPDLRTVALARLGGEGTGEIATRLGCARRTVERKLALIARLWEAGDSP